MIAFSHTDRLTHLLNRRGFARQTQQELLRSERYRRPLSLLTIDIDHFKHVSKTYGSSVGDKVLRELGRCLREAVRPSDVLGHLDDGQFAILLPETDLSSATTLVERLSTKVEQMNLVYSQTTVVVVISIGMAEFALDGTAIKPQAADQMLREAKLSTSTTMSSRG